MKNRKAVPKGSVPSEIWRVLLNPRILYRRPRYGLGAGQLQAMQYTCRDQSMPDMHAFDALQTKLLATIRAANCTPRQWHLSRAAETAKGNGKKGFDGIRLIHILDSYPKAYYKAKWRKHQYRFPTPNHAFAVPGRRREHAIAIKLILMNKMKRHRISFLSRYWDVKMPSPQLHMTQLPAL